MAKKLNLDEIKTLDFPKNQYYQSTYPKKQIYIHHTVSGKGVLGDVKWWKQTKERVATCVIIARDGTIYQLFSSRQWGHHLGIKSNVFKKHGITPIYRKYKSGKIYLGNNEALNQESIGIELDSWGGLTKKNGVWYNAANQAMKSEDVVEYPEGYRGFYAFERYTDAQIESTRQLIEYWGEVYGIDISYKGDEIFDIDLRALRGEEGVWTHTSVRSDKSDCHHQFELKHMLNSF